MQQRMFKVIYLFTDFLFEKYFLDRLKHDLKNVSFFKNFVYLT